MSRLPALIPALLVILGTGMVALALNAPIQPAGLPYERTFAAAPNDAATNLTIADRSVTNALQRGEWRVAGMREPVATALIATSKDGRPVPLDWRNNVTEPVFSADLTLSEVDKVMAAIKEHVPTEAVVLSWWDLSRKIRVLAGREAPLDDPLARGLIVPTSWAEVADRVLASEKAFWGAGIASSEADKFTRFIEALLVDEETGTAALAALAPGKDIYVAVHLSDAWKVASSRPEQLAIGYRDFPTSGQSHGVVKTTREWIKSEKIKGGYAVEPIGHAVRLHYLNDKDSSDLLIAKLLPFSTSNPMRLKGLQLVFQHRGYWIYKLNRNAS